jgi:DNA-binding transcriptional LysR family regulator
MAFADIELRHFVALRAVAQEGSFGRAAARLGYTQSAVSQQIAALERAVGAAVFDRPGGPRPVTLTAVGELLVDHGGALERTLACAEHDLRRLLAGQGGRIAVGTFQSVSVAVLPGMVRTLRTERPDLVVELFESDDGDVLADRLRDGQLDLSFVVDAWEHGLEGCELEVLHTDPFVLVSPRSATASTVSVRDLVGMPLIGQPANQCQFLIDQGLRQHGVEPDYVFRSADNSAVQAMVKAGMGEAVMPLLAVDVHDPDLAVRTLEPAIEPRRIGIAWRSGRTLSPAACAFIELARQAFAAVAVPATV